MKNDIEKLLTPKGRYAHAGIAVPRGICTIYLTVAREMRMDTPLSENR